MKKYIAPTIGVTRFSSENVVTVSGFDNSETKSAAVAQLTGDSAGITEENIFTLTF